MLGAPWVKSHLWHPALGGSRLSPCSPCHRGRDAAVLFQCRSPLGREHGEGAREALGLRTELLTGALCPPELSHHHGARLGARPPCSSSGCTRVLRAPLPDVPLGSSSRDRPGLGLLEEIDRSLSMHTLAPDSTGAESLPGNYIQEHKQVIERPCWQKHQDLISA